MHTDEPHGPTVRVSVTLTFDEYRVASHHLRTKRYGRIQWLWSTVLTVLVLLVIFKKLTEGDFSISWDGYLCTGCLLLLAGSGIVSPLLAASSDRKQWDAHGELREPRTYVFAASGVQIASSSLTTNVNWQSIASAHLVGSLVLLTTAQGDVWIVPVRAFESAEDRRTFQQLAEALVADCKL